MNITKPIKNYKKGPEAKIQDAIIKMLREKGWWVKTTHGNMYSTGWPDLYAAQRKYGTRWIEIKNPESFRFTPAQVQDFTRMAAEGIGVWILVSATEDEYQKLFQRPNFWAYLNGSIK